ncbi:hypothetical protein B4113_2337 [Geobacillus sp. B4113_201601]|nr:hypothetical protein B4113_2337 [Geobacillus sp. B4113_201601]
MECPRCLPEVDALNKQKKGKQARPSFAADDVPDVRLASRS